MTMANPPAQKPGNVRIGLIAKAHGVRGEVSVMPLTSDPRRFELLSTVFVEDDDLKLVGGYDIEYVRYHKNRLLLKFKGFDGINEVAVLKGKYIAIDEKDLAKLPDGSHYVFDLIGCMVINLSGELLGEVADVLETGSNDVYIVRGQKDGEKTELLIPAIKSVVKEILTDEKKIIVDLMPESEG